MAKRRALDGKGNALDGQGSVIKGRNETPLEAVFDTKTLEIIVQHKGGKSGHIRISPTATHSFCRQLMKFAEQFLEFSDSERN